MIFVAGKMLLNKSRENKIFIVAAVKTDFMAEHREFDLFYCDMLSPL